MIPILFFSDFSVKVVRHIKAICAVEKFQRGFVEWMENPHFSRKKAREKWGTRLRLAVCEMAFDRSLY